MQWETQEMPVRLCILGRNGQLARAMLEKASALGWQVEARGRQEIDLLDPGSLRQLLREMQPHVVLNTAAYTAVDKAEEEPDAAFALNCDAVANIARVCAELAVPLVHISTDYVFDGHKAGPYVEEDEPAPLNVYGRSKLAGEQKVRELLEQHMIVRTSWLFSPWGHNFVRTMLHLAQAHNELRVVADQHGNPTYVPHLADALLIMMQHILQAAPERQAHMWGTFHLAGSGAATWHELARAVILEAAPFTGRKPIVNPISTAEYPAPAQRPANSTLDCGSFLNAFGLALPPWQEGVRACVYRLCTHEVGKGST